MVHEAVQARRADDDLTLRQAEVLALVALGWANAEIAAQLQISVRTVEMHRFDGMGAIGATSRADVVQWSIRTGRFRV